MTLWKETGVVPDSDDDDFSDSQNTDDRVGAPHAQVQALDFTEGNALGEISADILQDVDASDVLSDFEARSPLDHIAQHESPFHELPELLDDIPPPESADATEEISRSYITLSSPLSTPPSSLGLTPEAIRYESQIEDRSAGFSLEELSPNPEGLRLDDIFDEFESMGRRSLRQRNPIQLHPYALEGEKYRRLVMASGIKPVRLAQESQESSAHQDNTDAEDIDFEVDFDSQDAVHEEVALASSPSLRTAGSSQESSANQDNTDAVDIDFEFDVDSQDVVHEVVTLASSPSLRATGPSQENSIIQSQSRDSSPSHNVDNEEFPDIDTLVEQRVRSVQATRGRKGVSSRQSVGRPRVYSRTQPAAPRRFISTKKRQSRIHWAATESSSSSRLPNIAETSERPMNTSRKRDFATFAETVPARPAQLETSDVGSRGRSDPFVGPPNIPKVSRKPMNTSRKRDFATFAETVPARPAQLETSDVGLTGRSDPHFVSTIKSMDSNYRKRHKGSTIKGDVQLARFLADDDMRPQQSQSGATAVKKGLLPQTAMRKKVVTRRKVFQTRLDVGEAEHRQPSEPLVLDHLQFQSAPTVPHRTGMLEGLGSFGTVYTVSFDIFPLQDGIFFHESTFIGSGRLKTILELSSKSFFASSRGYAVYQVGDKHLRWGPWNETVSTEIGGCFDWMTEQLAPLSGEHFQTNVKKVVECLVFVIDYIQNHLSFFIARDAEECLLRLVEVSQVLFEFITSCSDDLVARKGVEYHQVTEVSVLGTVLLLEAFQISGDESVAAETRSKLENSLLEASKLSIKMLMAGLDDIRTLYDDLQHLKIREAGIKPDQRAAQGFVVMMHILRAASVPRSSFWDLVNSHLVPQIKNESDAHLLEKTWYTMMSLLPLADFDRSGVVASGVRSRIPFENWHLPQKLCQRVFELYSSNEKQSASFNEYCRALFRRCHHLMHCWGWQHCGAIIGVLFDFFATHNLAHLRNEEVYASPRFLSEAYPGPSLAIEAQDCTFHIFLKFLASAINQMRESADEKGIRNLVTRVLPNHKRQYPRDKSIQRRDLASLRNHHDLLCTLYFAAPAESKPSLTLIRDLVSHDNSHKEASLINLEAWNHLAHFCLSSGLTPSLYRPLASWQSEAFYQLTLQFVSTEKDIEAQLPHLLRRDKIHTPSEVQKVVENNKIVIMDILKTVVGDIRRLIGAVKTLEDLCLVFNDFEDRGMLKVALQYFQPHDPATTDLLIDVMKIVHLFMKKRNRMIYGYEHVSGELIAYRSDHLEPIQENVALLCNMVQTCIASATVENSLTEVVVETWAFVVKSLILSQQVPPHEFIISQGLYRGVDLEDQTYNGRLYAPLFLGYLVRGRTAAEASKILVDRWDIIADFLCMLVKPERFLQYVWFAMFELVQAKQLEIIRGGEIDALMSIFSGRSLVSPLNHFVDDGQARVRRPHLLKETFKILARKRDEKLIDKTRLAHLLTKVLDTMKSDKLELSNNTEEERQHRKFVTETALQMKTYFPQQCDYNAFFEAVDPKLPRQQIFKQYLYQYSVNHGSPQLGFYLLESFKTIVHYKVTSRMMTDQLVFALAEDNTPECILLARWILIDLTPAFISAAARHPAGWFMAFPIIEAAILKICHLVQSNHPLATEATLVIMESMIDGLWQIKGKYDGGQITTLQSGHLILLDLMFLFVNATVLNLDLPNFDAGDHEGVDVMNLLQHFYFFALKANDYLRSPILALCGNSLQDVLHNAIMNPPAMHFLEKRDPYKMDEILTGLDEQCLLKRVLIVPRIMRETVRKYTHLTLPNLCDLFRTAGQFAHHPLPIQASDMQAIKEGKWPKISELFHGLGVLEGFKPSANTPRFAKSIIEALDEWWIFEEDTGLIYLKFREQNRASLWVAGRLEVDSRQFQRNLMDELKIALEDFLKGAQDMQKRMAARRGNRHVKIGP